VILAVGGNDRHVVARLRSARRRSGVGRRIMTSGRERLAVGGAADWHGLYVEQGDTTRRDAFMGRAPSVLGGIVFIHNGCG